MFAGSFCYADDIVLLAPCASALRCMLNICCRYAFQHGLKFNAAKTKTRSRGKQFGVRLTAKLAPLGTGKWFAYMPSVMMKEPIYVWCDFHATFWQWDCVCKCGPTWRLYSMEANLL